MDRRPQFVEEYLTQAQELLEKKAVLDPTFSKGTYQFEVREKGGKKAFVFLQMDDSGELGDYFCSCKVSESGGGCPHLAASYLTIFNHTEEPLHVRFKHSFWNRLFQMASKHHGYGVECLQKGEEGQFSIYGKNQELWFSIQSKTEAARKKLDALLFQRPVETEETSIKFSNLSLEDIESYRKGKGKHSLLYELSFFSDLAKWCMELSEKGREYTITFQKEPLPKEIDIDFPEFHLYFYVTDANWPWLIPSLSTVKSPLKVFDREENFVESVTYDPFKHKLLIKHYAEGSEKGRRGGVVVGEWLYVPNEGFYRNKQDPILSKSEITKEQLGLALTDAKEALSAYLPISFEKKACQYHLFFDDQKQLHIELFLNEPGDLSGKMSAIFPPWVYQEKKGFFLLEEWFFPGKERIISQENVADFINTNRLWLHQFPGFQTHLGSLESHLSYTLSDEGLFFHAELKFTENTEKTFHFDEWVYIEGQGFYMKKEAGSRLALHPGLKVGLSEIAEFIRSHKEELEQVQNFYVPEGPIESLGLKIFINENKRIVVSPQIQYKKGINPDDLIRFGDFIYIKDRGFSEIPSLFRLPEKYQKEVEIPDSQESSFLAYEVEALKPYTVEMDPRILRPERLRLKIRKIAPSKRSKKRDWLIDLIYVSEIGTVDVFSIWDAFEKKQRHFFSNAGLLYLQEPRFNWIRQLRSKQLNRNKGLIRLSTLEWIRLTLLEPFELVEDAETMAFLKELENLETSRLLDLSILNATLRPYQEQGVNWLWFLYCHGLSGLLCDDMGLGKTHQAMALLAGVIQTDRRGDYKYLVVCPTSVIYHWQEQLKRFLPSLRVLTYYGVERSLEGFEEDYDLVLTSYGILRTGKENFKKLKFEVAIFDEIQVAKNYASQTHKALRAIRSQMRLGLSGTPIENRIRELKSLMDIVLPAYLPSDPVFRDVFINPIEKHQDLSKKKLLAQLVKPFILRRKKGDVLKDLPEKFEEIAYSDLSAEQKQLYSEVALSMKTSIYGDLRDQTKPLSFVHIFSMLSRLKQICDHPALFFKEPKKYQKHSSGKWDLFVELLSEAQDSNQKVVIFSQYLEMLMIIETYLKKKGIGFASIKGSTKDRPEQLRRFREDPNCMVFVASLLAAGVGIDLTVASIVIHYDRWWNPAKENQATDRVHRIGQNRGVQVFKLVTKDTIEEHIHEMIERKKGLIEDIIGTEDQINYLTREELMEVFEKMFENL